MTENQARLTGRQRAFVSAYLTSWNGTRAAGEAGYAGDDAALATAGSRLLTNAKVKDAISAALQESAVDVDQALSALWSIATADPGDLAAVLRETTPSAAMTTARRLGVSRLVKAIQPTAHGVSVVWHDSTRALEIIMRHVAPTRLEVGLERIDYKKCTTAELEHIVAHGWLPR
jgi:phage terminase small subunit